MRNDQFFKMNEHMLDDDNLAGMMLELNSAESFGIYMILLLHLRQKDEYEGSCSPVTLKVIARRYGLDEEMIKRVIYEFGLFKVDEERQMFRSPYLDEVMEPLEAKRRASVENGKKGGRPRKNKESAETPASKGEKPKKTQYNTKEDSISITTVMNNSSNTKENTAPETSVADATASAAVAVIPPDGKLERPPLPHRVVTIFAPANEGFAPALGDPHPGAEWRSPRRSQVVSPALTGGEPGS